MKFFRTPKLALLMAGAFVMAACAGSQQAVNDQDNSNNAVEQQSADEQNLNRVLPYPLDIPLDYQRAQQTGTRTVSGEPGESYWTQRAVYDIDIKVIPADTILEGSQTVQYINNSPDTLNAVVVNLLQNYHAEGAVRNEMAEVTGGYSFSKIAVEGVDAAEYDGRWDTLSYALNGTVMYISGFNGLAPNDTLQLDLDWSFKIPQKGISGRMGYSEDNLFYIGYFYPHIAVYDDVIGWHAEQFRGTAEFYSDFANYDVSVTAPGNWLVYGTGDLLNAEENLAADVYERMVEAHQSDEIMQVVGPDQFGSAATTGTEDDWLTWEFHSENVRDVAFSLTTESIWDATRTPVGDVDGDGENDYSKINSFYRESAPLWKENAEYTAHSIATLSTYLDFPYPWPHMTSVEGAGIIGGGMEFPMITIMGDYNSRGAESLYNVTAHEIAHMWMPMIASSNERRYAWMDEGATSYNEQQSRKDYYPNKRHEVPEWNYYYRVALMDLEGPIIRRSDFHYNGAAYGVASYTKPAAVLSTLRGVLGEETFLKGWREYMDRWAYKNPYPWDMFNTFEDVADMELDWFWRSWYYETWVLDQAVESVNKVEGVTEIVIIDKGLVPMPVHLTITTEDGTITKEVISVNEWLEGKTNIIFRYPGNKTVTKVEIDADEKFPDIRRGNNTWRK